MADRSRTEKSEEDRLVNWGWGLGLLLPVVGVMVAALLFTRHDPRWPWIIAWSLLGAVLYAVLFSSI